MSSSAEPGPSVPKDEKEKRGIQKLMSRGITRMKTVLKKPADGSKRRSILGSSKPKQPTADTGEPAPAEGKGKEVEAAAPVKETKSPYDDDENVIKISRSELYEKRAQELSERFGLKLEPSEWYRQEGTALRKEKPIRMRVRRTCHQCNSTFGVDKECPSCGHPRCKQCIRYPPKRTDAEKAASRQRRLLREQENKENAPIMVDWRQNQPDIVLTRPCRQGGQDLVHKKPRQRVRRTCHECQALFTPGNKTCQCGHIRCTDCPRDPPKKDKYPFGYPGDEFGPSAVPVHECHECKNMFPPGADYGVACVSCKHEKCKQCRRLKPRRVEPQPDPDILRSVQEKLAHFSLQAQ